MVSDIVNDGETAMAYKAIHDYFVCTDLKTAIDEMESILMFTLEDSFWNKKNNPSYVIFCMQQLEALCAAAFAIHESGDEKEAAKLKFSGHEPDMKAEQDFVTPWAKGNTWNNFPRNLTAQQYYNPYRAIRKFCRYMSVAQWKKIFAALTEFSLSHETMEEIDIPYNLFKLRKRLLQFIEACHLIDVRIYQRRGTEEKKPTEQQHKK